MDLTEDVETMLSIKMSELHIDYRFDQRNRYNDISEIDMKDIALTSRKRLRSEDEENEGTIRIRKKKSLPSDELQVIKRYKYENEMQEVEEYKENLQSRKMVRNSRDARRHNNGTPFAEGMNGERKWARDLIRRNRAELTKIEEEIQMWKQTYSESAKILEQLLIQKNKLTAELKNSMRLHTSPTRKYRFEIIKRTGPAHIGHNHNQGLSLFQTSSENNRLPFYLTL